MSDETWRIAIGWVGEDVRAARIRRPADGANAIFRSPEEVLDHALAALQEKEHKRKASKPRKNLAQFLMESPLAGAELNLERQNDYGRPVKL